MRALARKNCKSWNYRMNGLIVNTACLRLRVCASFTETPDRCFVSHALSRDLLRPFALLTHPVYPRVTCLHSVQRVWLMVLFPPLSKGFFPYEVKTRKRTAREDALRCLFGLCCGAKLSTQTRESMHKAVILQKGVNENAIFQKSSNEGSTERIICGTRGIELNRKCMYTIFV